MSNFERIFARRNLDRGKFRREQQRDRGAFWAGEAARRDHASKIQPIAPAGVSQPGARRKAS